MQDRFRYRVWDKTQNKWLHFDFSTYPTYQDRIWQALTDGETFYQCIGLKDKNGKLIYEGDILKDKYGALHPISWNIKGFYEADTFAVAGFYKAIQEDMEVIGNIYENPELLED